MGFEVEEQRQDEAAGYNNCKWRHVPLLYSHDRKHRIYVP